MDFNEMFEKFKDNDKGNTNLNKGASLLEHLAEADMSEAMSLITNDGAIDGAFYILYKHLAEEGLLEHVIGMEGNPFEGEAIQKKDCMLITLSTLKYIMYTCFMIGANQMKSLNTVVDLWNLPDSEEPNRD